MSSTSFISLIYVTWICHVYSRMPTVGKYSRVRDFLSRHERDRERRIDIHNTMPWMNRYTWNFFSHDNEREGETPMDNVIYNWTQNKSGVMFSGVFTNNSVLQREPQYAAVYGTCDTPHTQITLTIKNENNNKNYSLATVSMHTGDWKILFPQTYKNGGNYTLAAHCEQCMGEPRNAIIYNITFGDIYLCLGQSNMQLEVEFTFNAQYTRDNITTLGKYSNIRFYHKRITRASDDTSFFVIPRDDHINNGKYQWHYGSNASSVNRFSAACWYTAQSLVDMYNMTHVNFGLIASARGGSQIESWIQNNSIHSSVCSETKNDCPGKTCGKFYNGMVLPFANMSIKGILWYQGENNVKQQMRNYSHVSPYSCLQKLMIQQYRKLWNSTYLPFGIVQLAAGTSEGHQQQMPYFRQAQTNNYGILPNREMINVFMAQAYDLGDPWQSFSHAAHDGLYPTPYDWNTTKWYYGSVHPRTKLYIGQRMAMNLNKFVYKNNAIWNGPLLKGCELNINDKIISVEFNENMLYDEQVIIQPLRFWYNASLVNEIKYWSTIKLLINRSWTDLDGMNVFLNISNASGYAINIDVSNVLNVSDIGGISYAWSDYPCCGDLDLSHEPCPMNMCPIITSKSRLPAIPFQAKIIDNKCQCFEPQKCDGSDYILPVAEVYDELESHSPTHAHVVSKQLTTLKPTSAPSFETMLDNIIDIGNMDSKHSNNPVHLTINIDRMTSFTVMAIFGLCILINSAIFWGYYQKKS